MAIAISFFSLKDVDEECVMRSKGDNTEIMVNDKAGEVVEELLSRYQTGLGTSMRGSEFVFDCAH